MFYEGPGRFKFSQYEQMCFKKIYKKIRRIEEATPQLSTKLMCVPPKTPHPAPYVQCSTFSLLANFLARIKGEEEDILHCTQITAQC